MTDMNLVERMVKADADAATAAENSLVVGQPFKGCRGICEDLGLTLTGGEDPEGDAVYNVASSAAYRRFNLYAIYLDDKGIITACMIKDGSAE
jgi:hypothetical protein